MSLINSNLVSADYDVLWDDISVAIKGAGPRNVLVLVTTYQSATEEAQLLKMLEASKLSPDQYNIIQVNKGQQIAWHKLRENLDPRVIFLVGVLPAQLGISSLFRLNAPNHFNDRVWLPTISLGEMEQHPDVKKQLWANGMKPVFVDKSYGAF